MAPDTLSDEIHVVLLFNVVNPDTFNADNIVELLLIKKTWKISFII